MLESMEMSKKSSQDDKSMGAIRNGLNVREDFWDDFLLVINNSGGVSELLDVPVTKIAGWHSKVREALDRVKSADAAPEPSDNGKLLKTGLPAGGDPKAGLTNPLGGE